MLTTALMLATLMGNRTHTKLHRPLLTDPDPLQITEICINPNGSNDETQGREFITLHGPANKDLTGYAIVVVENETSSGGNDGRGTIDNIIPLDGYVTNSDGNFCVRDSTDNGGMSLSYGLGTFGDTSDTTTHKGWDPFVLAGQNQSWPSRDGTKSEMVIDFNSLYTLSLPARGGQSSGTLHFGGNTLENGGGNYFVVYNINPAVVQQEQTSGGTKIQDGSALDTDQANSNGTFDYQNGNGNGPVLADFIVDGVYVGEGSDDTTYLTSLDYVTNCAMSTGARRAVFPLLADNWQYNNNSPKGVKTVAAWAHTPDAVMRLRDGVGGNYRTHTSKDVLGNSVTIDDLLAIETNTSGVNVNFFKQASNNEVLWDLTDVSSSFSSTKAYVSPTYSFNFTNSSVTYYHP